jgi:putative ABC transport system permease protein
VNLLPRTRSFLRATFRRRAVEREMDNDLAVHVAERVDDLVSQGVPRADAARQAARELGDPAKWRLEGREARGTRYVDDLRADVFYALRWLRRSPAFAATAVLSLGIGIGANAAIFNLIDVVLFRALPVQDPDELVLLTMERPNEEPSRGFSYAMFRAFERDTRSLVGIAATTRMRLSIEIDGVADTTVAGQLVSGGYYSVLGVPAALGRPLLPSDDGAPGTGAVAVLSYGFWQRRFGRDPSVLGRRIALNEIAFTIVGVSAEGFSGTHVGESVDVTVPLSIYPLLAGPGDAPRLSESSAEFWLELIGRRRPGVRDQQVQSELEAVFQPLYDDWMSDPKARVFGRHTLAVESGSRGVSELRRRFSRPLWVLMGAVGLVLLIACANVANLLLARAAVRGREMAVRISLGATRLRLARQLLAESVLLACLGGAVGLLLTTWTSGTLAAILTDGGRALPAHPDVRVFAFTTAVAVSTGIVFGLAPAVGVSHLDAGAALKDGGRGSASGGRRFGLRGILVAVQVAVSVVLLVCASLFVRTLWNLRTIDLGMDQEHVLTLRLEPIGSNQKRGNEARLRLIYERIVTALQRAPGVRAVSLTGTTPLSDENQFGAPITVDGYVPAAGEDMHVRFVQVYPGYLQALGVRLLGGRDLEAQDDRPDAPLRAVVNEAMANRFFASAPAALGRGFTLPNGSPPPHVEIVGVAADTRDRSMREAAAPRAYFTFARASTGRGQMTLLVHASGDPRALVSVIRQVAHEADPTMPLFEVQTIADRVAAQTRQEQLVALLTTLFGIVAALLAAIGLYGVVAYTVTSRRTEFGVRLALGATPGRLRRLVLGDSLLVVTVGLIGGFAASVTVTRWIAQMLFGIQPFDPLSFAASASMLVGVATIAAWLPARHAARVDPIVVLRQN